ncbi:uncharacterized protein LOC133056261 [Dama dama]|uniref:uncharacterized protein LOC133056261 n=1 Tax=Dama dama TaxID=30532 RepID=UPI002A35B51C|nr:uncharacterized protein LOC133056261 [Dama dama]
MDCILPGSSVHGILQKGVLEWVAMPFSRGSSQPRDLTCISCPAGTGKPETSRDLLHGSTSEQCLEAPAQTPAPPGPQSCRRTQMMSSPRLEEPELRAGIGRPACQLTVGWVRCGQSGVSGQTLGPGQVQEGTGGGGQRRPVVLGRGGNDRGPER